MDNISCKVENLIQDRGIVMPPADLLSVSGAGTSDLQMKWLEWVSVRLLSPFPSIHVRFLSHVLLPPTTAISVVLFLFDL